MTHQTDLSDILRIRIGGWKRWSKVAAECGEPFLKSPLAAIVEGDVDGRQLVERKF